METHGMMKIFHFEGNKVEIKQQESQVIRQCLHNFHMAYIVCCVLEEGTYPLIGLSRVPVNCQGELDKLLGGGGGGEV